jgi:hypothetical protein
MLNDHEIEARLRRYRVTDPPPDLAHTIVAASVEPSDRFDWIWGPATAAAVLVAWIAFHVATSEPQIDAVRAREVAFVTEVLGGDESAAAYAETVVPESPKPDLQMALMLLEELWLEN